MTTSSVSVCIFGSAARQSADELSDKDVLVVGTPLEICESIAEFWVGDGWSVSTFRREDFRNIAAGGSLFLQHLKREGIVLRDDDGFLESIFDLYSPNKSYLYNYNESICTIYLLDTDKCNSYWEKLCVADIACVTIRNAAILQMAEKGIFEFDFNKVIGMLANEANLDQDLRSAVLELRRLKHCYRNRIVGHPLGTIVERALQGARALFAPVALTETCLGDYNTLRFTELALVRVADPRELDSLPVNHPLKSIWSVITIPRPYPRVVAINAEWSARNMAIAERYLGKSLRSCLYTPPGRAK